MARKRSEGERALGWGLLGISLLFILGGASNSDASILIVLGFLLAVFGVIMVRPCVAETPADALRVPDGELVIDEEWSLDKSVDDHSQFSEGEHESTDGYTEKEFVRRDPISNGVNTIFLFVTSLVFFGLASGVWFAEGKISYVLWIAGGLALIGAILGCWQFGDCSPVLVFDADGLTDTRLPESELPIRWSDIGGSQIERHMLNSGQTQAGCEIVIAVKKTMGKMTKYRIDTGELDRTPEQIHAMIIKGVRASRTLKETALSREEG